MCIGIPAEIVEIIDGPLPTARLDIAGEQRECCLAYVPEAEVGDFVLIQNGFAMTILDRDSALESLDTIQEMNLIEETRRPGE